MRQKFATLTLTLLALAGTASAGTFLQVFETDSTVREYVLTNNAGTSNTLSVTNGAVNFQFSVPNTLGTGIRPGLLTFTANTTTPDTSGGGNFTGLGWSGSGSVFDTTTSTIAFSWSFGPGGTTLVAAGGTGGTLTDSRPPASEVSMTSAYMNFATSVSESFTIAMSGAQPVYALGAGNFLANNAASGLATFDAEPLPVGAPEPATMLILGSALTAVALIGRKRLAR